MAIVLRYLEAMEFRQIATALGITEDAAQKRVTRALERLRGFLAPRGIELTGSSLAAALTSEASTPIGLSAQIANSVLDIISEIPMTTSYSRA
jgi:hypothetical protein